MRKCFYGFLALSITCMGGAVRAAVVKTGPLPGIGALIAVPAFRVAVLERISLYSSLDDRSLAPTLSQNLSGQAASPLAAAAGSVVPNSVKIADPIQSAAERFVGALVAKPQVVVRHREELLSALGERGAGQLQEVAVRMEKLSSENKVLAAQLSEYRRRLNLDDPEAVQEFGASLGRLFDGAGFGSPDSSGMAVEAAGHGETRSRAMLAKHGGEALPAMRAAVPAPLRARIILGYKADRPEDEEYAGRFAGIQGVESIQVWPITVPVFGEPRTRRTDIFVNFRDLKSLEAAKNSGNLPRFGDLRGWFTGYHVIARLDPIVAERERAARDRAQEGRYAAIPGVMSANVHRVTVPVLGSPETWRGEVYVDFRSVEALQAAKRSGRWPRFAELRGWITGYHLVARIKPDAPLPAERASATGDAGPGSSVPSWFDASKLSFVYLSKSSDGSYTAVLRYGLIRTYELLVSVSPKRAERDLMLFKEYALNPMAPPKRSEDVPLRSMAARHTAARILRGALDRGSLNAEQKVALDELLSILEPASARLD